MLPESSWDCQELSGDPSKTRIPPIEKGRARTGPAFFAWMEEKQICLYEEMLTLFRRCEPAVAVPPVRGKTLTAIGFLSGLICPSPALSVWAGSYGKAGSLPPGSSNQTSGPVGFTISVFPMAASAVFCALLQNPLCRFPAAAAASEGSDSCAAVLQSCL